MDDSCAVCADNLEWVAYGPCGHREVCSTCVVRLRFICDDRRCCICKAVSDVVFITKAMGDYTRMISDFSQFPAAQGKEGKVGSFWYHDDTQAFFDDAEHYKMIKATCRLSCSVCDKAATEELPQQDGGFRKRQRFRSIGQLKGHLAHQHKLLMCDLCLEGRKVFISEQKLYTKAQLSQHKRTGDSVVDGTESERGGFSGHPLCEFCLTSFYGENELYTHMSREHFTCHICQRRHPEHYEYYKDYDDLESHFLRDHHLCEDEECLRRKFIVFQTAEDLKRHNALEHGGRMSRSQRNAALQIPTSFRYTSNNESGYHRGRRRSFRREPSAEANGEFEDSLERVISLAGPSSSPASTEPSNVEPLMQPFEQLSTSDSEARYRQAVSQISATGHLAESSFPPLAGSSSSSQQKSHSKSKNTMAARLRGRGNSGRVNVLNVAQPRIASSALFPAPVTQAPRPAAITPAPRPTAPTPAPLPAAPKPAPRPTAPMPVARPAQGSAAPGPAPATSAPWPSLVPASASGQIKAPISVSGSSSYAGSLRFDEPGLASGGSWVSVKPGGSKRLNHSSSAPNLVGNKFDPVADFPPVSAAQSNRPQPSGKNKIEDVQTANKSLVERMRAALDYDEDKYNAFKGISHEYRLGSIDTWEYFSYVQQFDLTHLVPDLARLCPEPDKEKELLEAYNASMQSNRREAFQGDGVFYLKGSSSSIKDKGKKVVNSGTSRPQESLADSVINTVRSLQSQFKPSDEIEVLEKDGYRASRGKSTVAVGGNPLESRGSNQQPPSQSPGGLNGQSSVDSAGPNKQKKKSKFHSRRLGDSSPAAVLDVRNSAPESGAASDLLNPLERPTTRGVWVVQVDKNYLRSDGSVGRTYGV